MTVEKLTICNNYNVINPKLDKERSKKLTGYPQIDKPWIKYYTDDALNATISKVTIYENLKNVCENLKKSCAIDFLDKKITYEKLLNRIDTVANAFAKLGVKDGDLVTLMLANTPENVMCIYALNKIGAIANFVDLRTSEDELKSYLNDSDSKVVVATDLFLPNLTKVLDSTNVEHVVVASPCESLPFFIKQAFNKKNNVQKIPNNYIKWKNFEKVGKSSLNIPGVSYLPNKPACITYTSGTTGKSKGVVLTNENFLAQVNQYKNCGLSFEPGEIFFNQVPPFLAYNAIMATNLPLSLGMHMVMKPSYEPENFAKNVMKIKANHVIAGPADWSNFLNNPKVETSDLSYMKTLASGGSHFDPTKKDKVDNLLAKHGCKNKIIEGYGMSEASTAVCTNLPQCNVNGSAGIPLPQTSIAVCNPETGEFLKYNEVGELCFTGPGIMKEYFKNPDATLDVLREHSDNNVYLHSGDLGYVTEDGIIYVSGRLKRVIVRHDGFKVSPLEIENVIMENPYVDDCCVVGVFDDEHQFGQIPVANVVLKENIDKDKDEIVDDIKQLCVNKIIDIHLPKKIVLVTKLPLTKVGKVDYRLLTEEYKNKVYQKKYSL